MSMWEENQEWCHVSSERPIFLTLSPARSPNYFSLTHIPANQRQFSSQCTAIGLARYLNYE